MRIATGLLFPFLPALAQLSSDATAVVEANNEFALKLYGEIARKPGNVFFSPYNISNALAMTYAGARGDTAAEMAAAMSIGIPEDRFHAGFSELDRELRKPDRPYALFLATRLWGEREYGFAQPFLDLVLNNYAAGVEPMDFRRDAEGSRQIINDWVQSQTNDRIRDLLPPGVITTDTRLVLTSAIYFKAAWAMPFNPERTSPGEFHLSAGEAVEVPMMRGFSRVRYSSAEDALAVELPYEKNELSMVLLLPSQSDGLNALEQSLTPAELPRRLNAMTVHDVDLALPRFTTTCEYSLKESLQALGMVKAWDPDQADLSGMVANGSRDLFISDAVHKAFIDVNEQGTEAAAATGIVVGVVSAFPPGRFHADRPFLYLIRDLKTGTILFMGRVSNPK